MNNSTKENISFDAAIDYTTGNSAFDVHIGDMTWMGARFSRGKC
jgi:hypothetical protein